MINKKFVALITDYVKNYQEKKQTSTAWREPIIGVAAGKVVFDRYRCNEQIYEKIVPEYPIGSGDAVANAWSGCPVQWRFPVKLKNEKVINNLRTTC